MKPTYAQVSHESGFSKKMIIEMTRSFLSQQQAATREPTADYLKRVAATDNSMWVYDDVSEIHLDDLYHWMYELLDDVQYTVVAMAHDRHPNET